MSAFWSDAESKTLKLKRSQSHRDVYRCRRCTRSVIRPPVVGGAPGCTLPPLPSPTLSAAATLRETLPPRGRLLKTAGRLRKQTGFDVSWTYDEHEDVQCGENWPSVVIWGQKKNSYPLVWNFKELRKGHSEQKSVSGIVLCRHMSFFESHLTEILRSSWLF